jgi:hypothetical protein
MNPPTPEPHPPRRKRERSARYPGRDLESAIELARTMLDRGLDGLPAESIAPALGFSNVKSNNFSSLLSAARQFGFLDLRGDGYHLTPLGRAIPRPLDEKHAAALRREAFLRPPLYSELATRLADRKLPDGEVLGNLLFHHHHITNAARRHAADVFLESARRAGCVDAEGLFRPRGAVDTPTEEPASIGKGDAKRGGEVMIELPLWGPDAGKRIQVRIPESITRESLERLMSAIQIQVRVADGPER